MRLAVIMMTFLSLPSFADTTLSLNKVSERLNSRYHSKPLFRFKEELNTNKDFEEPVTMVFNEIYENQNIECEMTQLRSGILAQIFTDRPYALDDLIFTEDGLDLKLSTPISFFSKSRVLLHCQKIDQAQDSPLLSPEALFEDHLRLWPILERF